MPGKIAPQSCIFRDNYARHDVDDGWLFTLALDSHHIHTSPPPQLITFTGTVVIFHTFVMISGVSRSLPPTNRMPHGVWWPSRSNVTASALNLCILSWTAEPRLVNELLCQLIGRWTARVGIKSQLSAYQLKTPLSKTLYSASATQNSS